MLSQEAADKILGQWKVEESSEEGFGGGSPTRFLPQYLKLPKKLRKIACGLYELDEQGLKLPKEDQQNQDESFRELLALSPKDRLRILSIPLPKLAPALEKTLVWQKSAPYQGGYERKAFRSRLEFDGTIAQQSNLLQGFLKFAERYQEDILTPAWCAIWAPHVRINWSSLEMLAPPLLAAVIQAGGKAGDEVFEILLQCGHNEHEHGSLGRHVVGGLLAADRPEGWEFVEKLLLAAQRQEGLRQVILETVDLAHPEAFQRLLKVVLEQDLARFSAVTRALNVWLGYAWDSANTRIINQTIRQVSTFLAEESARKKAAAGSDPEAAYLALWAMSIFDAADSIAPATKLLLSKQVELRYVATVHLRNLQLPQLTTSPLRRVMDDEDLRIAYLAATAIGDADDASHDQFERLERLISRLPVKPEVLHPLVWPWLQGKVDRSQIANLLVASLGDRPFSRLVPYLPMLNPWARVRVLSYFADNPNWLPEVREMVIRLAGDSSSDVRRAALRALEKITLTGEESEQLEGLLTRKTADLRSGVIRLLIKLPDEAALASADRLLNSKSIPQRLAGLELVRGLKEQERSVDECLSRAASYREGRKKIAKEEETHLDAIQAKTSPTAGLSLENGLGLFDPSQLSPGQPPKEKKVAFWTKAAEKSLLALDELIHSHRETPVTLDKKTVLLGTVTWWQFPSASSSQRGLRELPLRDVWEGWVKNRPGKLRDRDGLELERALYAIRFAERFEYSSARAWLEGSPARKPVADLVRFKIPKLRYPHLVQRLLEWMPVIEPPCGVVDYLTDCVETLCAKITPEDLQSLHPDHARPSGRTIYSRYQGQIPDFEDWREQSPVSHWRHLLLSECTRQELEPAQLQRVWKFSCWFDRPFPGAMRDRPGEATLFQAYQAKLAHLDDVGDALLGPRETGSHHLQFWLLNKLTSRRPEKFYTNLLQQFPELHDLLERAVARILEIELARGDTPTIATQAALDIASLNGINTLRRILATLGKTGFKVANAYDRQGHFAEVLTHLASVTYPAEDESPEQFREVMKAAVKAREFPEERLIQLAFLAPQWVKHIEEYFRWPGLSEGIYWFLAHMSFLWGSNVGEKAAEGAGIVDEVAEIDACAVNDDSDSSDADTSEETESETTPATPPAPRLSPWQRLIVERTPLSLSDREAGAVDVAWFHRVYDVLRAKRWQELAQAARFASNSAQARKAQTIADVLLGKADLKGLIAGIEQRQLKDNVRLLGLYPLPNGVKRDAELKRRFLILQAYQRYARGLSGLTKPQAMQALDTGLKNLAATAGYADPIRLEWALGAEELKDLSKGPVTATKEGVSVTLELNEASQPVLSFARGEKPLKSVPAAIKKDPKIAELFERSKDIKRKASRLRAALEQCMCRGDTFSSQELISLMTHPLVAPLLQRLVLAGDGILGYPDHHGKALRDSAGKLEPVKKGELLRIAHPDDLFLAKNWSDWQRDCFKAERIQPFKQVFRELYVLTKQERADRDASHRYAGQQVNPQQAYALWGNRGWNTGDGVFKTFHELGLTAIVDFNCGITTPLEVEGLTLDSIRFYQRKNEHVSELLLKDVPRRVFSEVMRDCDLVVSVAHRGGVDPEASASTVEMRASLVKETAQLMGLKNVRIKANQVLVDGSLSQYSVHLGSGSVHRLPGGSVCIVPVHAQHRGRLFLPFADDDPRSAEVLSKVLLLARDQEIQDPSILEQLRA